jgi:hypothetical protein
MLRNDWSFFVVVGTEIRNVFNFNRSGLLVMPVRAVHGSHNLVPHVVANAVPRMQCSFCKSQRRSIRAMHFPRSWALHASCSHAAPSIVELEGAEDYKKQKKKREPTKMTLSM